MMRSRCRPLGIVGIVVGDLQVESGNDLHHGERATGVAGAGGAKRHQVVAAHQAGSLLQFLKGEIANYGFGKGVANRHDHPLCG